LVSFKTGRWYLIGPQFCSFYYCAVSFLQQKLIGDETVLFGTESHVCVCLLPCITKYGYFRFVCYQHNQCHTWSYRGANYLCHLVLHASAILRPQGKDNIRLKPLSSEYFLY
jgi:hypothetical protein